MKFSISIFLLLSFILNLYAQDQNKIVHLNLIIVKEKVFLESVKITDGKLKGSGDKRSTNNQILYRVFTANKEKLYESVINDPAVKTYEYVDDQNMLRHIPVVTDSAFLYIRLPYDESIQHLKFFKITETDYNQHQILDKMKEMGDIYINLEDYIEQ